MKTSVDLQILKTAFFIAFLVWSFSIFAQTHTIDEENHNKAVFHIRHNTDSIPFYITKMKQSKNQCRVLFAMLYEANMLYAKNEYESCVNILDTILSEIDNNPKPETFIYSKIFIAKNYEDCLDLIKLNVYRRFFFVKKNEGKLTEAYDYLILRQNILENLPKNDIYYLKNKISTNYSMATLKRQLGKFKESLDILIKINKEIDSAPILKTNFWAIQKEKANINVLTGQNYIDLENYDLAELYFNKAYTATQKADIAGSEFEDYYRKAQLHYYREDYKKSLDLINKASSYHKEEEKINATLYNLKAKIYSKLKNYDSAIYFSDRLANNRKLDLIYNYGDIIGILAENYFALKEIDSAYKYSQLSLKYYNKLNTEKNQILDVLNENELSQAVALNKSIEKKRKALENKLIITIISAILFVITIILLSIRKRKLLKKKIETFKKQLDELQKSNIKKETINTIDDETTRRILNDLRNLENSTIFLDKDFSLAVLAKLLNTNTSYLSRIINDHKQKTFKQYLVGLRINVLIKNLEEQPTLRKYSIEALAESIGYKNASSFTRIFKNHTGVSPSRYLKEKYTDS